MYCIINCNDFFFHWSWQLHVFSFLCVKTIFAYTCHIKLKCTHSRLCHIHVHAFWLKSLIFFSLPYIYSVFYEVAKVPALPEEALTSWGHVLITLWRTETNCSWVPAEHDLWYLWKAQHSLNWLCILKPQKIYKAPLKLRISFHDKYRELCNAGF